MKVRVRVKSAVLCDSNPRMPAGGSMARWLFVLVRAESVGGIGNPWAETWLATILYLMTPIH